MNSQAPDNQIISDGIAFWARLWQAQFDHSLKAYAAFAQAMPRKSAQQLSDEAEALRQDA